MDQRDMAQVSTASANGAITGAAVDPAALSSAITTAAQPSTLAPFDSTLAPAASTTSSPGNDTPASVKTSPPTPQPKVHLKVLLITGQHHIFSFEPETTVGRMKELIWSMWPTDWSDPAQPHSPSWIRVLYAGRVLGDESTLAANNMPVSLTPDNPSVVHLAIRAWSIHGDDDQKKGFHRATSRRSRRGSTGSAVNAGNANQEEIENGCCCVVM